MAVLSAVSVKFVAMGLSRELAGAYNSAYGYLQLFAILADFGLYAVSVREVAVSREKERVLGGLLVIRTAITVISLGTAVIVAWLVPAWRGSPLSIGISIASLVPFFTLLAGVLRTVFQIRYKMHLVFIAEVLQRILTTGLMALVILRGVRLSDDVRIYSWFLWIGAAGSLLLFVLSVFFAVRLMRIRPVFDRVLIKKLLKKAAPYGIAFLCIALYRQFDMTMIALLRDDFAVQNAAYGFASRITEMTFLVPTFLLNSTLPILSERHSKGEPVKGLLGKTFFLILIFGSVSALFSFFWSWPIMRLLTAEAYLSRPGLPGADTALKLLSVPQFLNGMVLFSFYVLLAKHQWRALVSRMMLAVVLSIGLNLYFIPSAGFVGAIRTSTIVHAFLVIAIFPAAISAMPVSFPKKLIVKWAGFSIILALGLRLTAPWLISLPNIVIGLVLAALALGLLGLIFRFDRVFLEMKTVPQDSLETGI